MGGVAVVTDSTCDLSMAVAEEHGLRMVPLSVAFGRETFMSRITITVEDFYDRLATADVLPTTSQPSPAWFEEAYADCADAGLDGVVSVHLSSALSGTVSVGRKKAEEAPLRVNVVDSHQVGGGLAITALAAQRAADRGESLEAVTAVAESVAAAVQTFVVVDTLEYLKKGGRLSSGRAAVGNMLRVKPILHVEGGRVELLEQTRTWSRALRRLVELMVDALAGEPADVIVSHALAPDHAADLWSALDDAIEVRAGLETIIGPIVGAHTGPGAVGVAVVPATLAG